ncbi:MAG: TonB-dependent receptor [Campylobacterales bacterium]|nr:TonB-dependent receptor [Campylobacterales bacterium]
MKKSLQLCLNTLPLLLPTFLMAQPSVLLEEVQVVEQQERKTNTIEIDLVAAEQQQADSFFDLFKQNPSTDVGGGAANAQRIYLRGLESSTANISLDGAKQGKNIFQHRGNELGINPDLLKTVDVKTAPDASKGGALSGAIEMTTKDAQDFTTSAKNSGGFIKSGYSTNAKHASAMGYHVADYFGAYVALSGVNANNYKDGKSNIVYATAYKDRDYFFKFSALGLQDHDLRISLGQNENSGNFQWGKAGSDTGIHDPNGPNPLEKILSTTTTYSLQHTYNPSTLVNLETKLNFSTIDLERKDNALAYKNETLGVTIQNHFDFATSLAQHRITAGAQWQDEKTKGPYAPHALDAAITKYAPTASQNRALFFQGKTTHEALTLHYGVRFDDYTFETGLGKATNHRFSPNVGVDYAFSENASLYANYGESSRMSGTIPFTWLTSIKKDTTYSSKLKPETSTRYEAGYKYTMQSMFFEGDKVGFDANIFQTKIKDLIVSKDVNCNAITGKCGSGEGGRTLQDVYNSAKVFESKGFEVKVFYAHEAYHASVSYAQIDTNAGNDDTGGNPDVNEQSSIRRVGAYDSKKLTFSGGMELSKTLLVDYTLNVVSGLDEAEIKRGGYTTHDISAKWKPSLASAWTFFAAITNLTNKAYGKHTTIANNDLYRLEPGREVKLSFKYAF